jgi:glycerophosphoryl diester phosphodiesterase|tara:strand:+ start:2913 stop:3716 length:804 start_codon:yes stop_codon:yes gene_type:complete
MIVIIIFSVITGLLIKHLFFWKPNSISHFYKGKSQLFIAHRGIHKEAPENTISAIKEAIKSGFSTVEMDVFSSLDREIVCSHNIDLERETEGQGFLDEKQSLELQDVSYRTYSANEKEKCIPLLSDILQKFNKNILFVLDVKTKRISHLNSALEIVKQIRNNDVKKSVVVSSFNPLLLLLIKCIDKKILTGFIFKNSQFLRLTNLIHPDFLHPRGDLINKRLIRYSNKKHLPINTWTVNNNFSWDWLFSMGVSGIITDESPNFSTAT